MLMWISNLDFIVDRLKKNIYCKLSDLSIHWIIKNECKKMYTTKNKFVYLQNLKLFNKTQDNNDYMC